MLTKLKAWLIAFGAFALTILTLGGYARYQRNRRKQAEQQNKQLQQAKQGLETSIQDYEERREQEAIAARMDDDAINQRLHEHGNLRD